ncbi:MAG: bifunctional glutamate N-acetyltransferase/amino-acid acetyltransferase ArgJ, partial [Gammaproteobacteria bacterium]
MAVNPKIETTIHEAKGVELGVAAGGIRYQGRDDLVLMRLAEGSVSACTFTLNRFRAAPVIIADRHLKVESPRFVLINAGNANAGTGQTGLDRALESCAAVVESSDTPTASVLPYSTGVIGQQLPMERMIPAIRAAKADLGQSDWSRAAKAIMTTDTVPKLFSRRLAMGDGEVTITGMSKGSGMICPNMATMLAFIATDATISKPELEAVLAELVSVSFNAITVDGDTSTNDACLLTATGQSGVELSSDHPDWPAFKEALKEVFILLAQSIIRDGEGATKFITVQVNGAETEADARAVAYTLAHSPLFKTAAFASDPNWGRILAAVGRAPVDSLDIDRVSISLNEVSLIEAGSP